MTAEDERGGCRNHPRRNAEARVGAEQKTFNLCRRTAVFRQDRESSPVLIVGHLLIDLLLFCLITKNKQSKIILSNINSITILCNNITGFKNIMVTKIQATIESIVGSKPRIPFLLSASLRKNTRNKTILIYNNIIYLLLMYATKRLIAATKYDTQSK